MLLNFITLLLFSARTHASGEFRVLHTPSSMKWIGEDQLDSSYLSDVLLAAQGHAVSGDCDWSGLAIKNPFTLAPTAMVVVHIEGIFKLAAWETLKVYELIYSETLDSIDNLIAELDPKTVYDINFINHTLGVEKYKNYFGNAIVPIATPIQYFKPVEYASHRQFLEEVGYMHAISENLSRLLKPSHVVVIRISLQNIVKINSYSLLYEAKKLIKQANLRLLRAARTITNAVLFVLTTDKKQMVNISGRSLKEANNTNPFGKQTARDFPIIFNIILWTTLLLALALAVVCYVIATIDPGEDSVLYRTSRTVLQRSHRKRK